MATRARLFMNSRAGLLMARWAGFIIWHFTQREMKCCVTAGGAAPLKEDGAERGLSLDPLLWRIGFGRTVSYKSTVLQQWSTLLYSNDIVHICIIVWKLSFKGMNAIAHVIRSTIVTDKIWQSLDTWSEFRPNLWLGRTQIKIWKIRFDLLSSKPCFLYSLP